MKDKPEIGELVVDRTSLITYRIVSIDYSTRQVYVQDFQGKITPIEFGRLFDPQPTAYIWQVEALK